MHSVPLWGWGTMHACRWVIDCMQGGHWRGSPAGQMQVAWELAVDCSPPPLEMAGSFYINLPEHIVAA